MIPAEAVEAAAKVLFNDAALNDKAANWTNYQHEFRRQATLALGAAAPHIAATALRAAAHSMELMPPLLRAQYVATLRLHADEPWRLGELHELPISATSDNASNDD